MTIKELGLLLNLLDKECLVLSEELEYHNDKDLACELKAYQKLQNKLDKQFNKKLENLKNN